MGDTIESLTESIKEKQKLIDLLQKEVEYFQQKVEQLQVKNFGTCKVGDRLVYGYSYFLQSAGERIVTITEIDEIDDEHRCLHFEDENGWKGKWTVRKDASSDTDGDTYDFDCLKLL